MSQCLRKYRTWNIEGESYLDFAPSYELLVANTCFIKRDNELVTFRTRVNATQIDYFLIRMIDKGSCLNCKVILRECSHLT